MHSSALVLTLATVVLAPAAARAEFVMQQAPPPAQAPFQVPDAAAERARMARAYWLRTHRGVPVQASAAQARPGVADGFGKGVPLNVALLQILPPGVTAQLGRDVDAGQAVDWTGGKPWQAVLRDLVQPLHLRAAVVGNLVRIDPAQD